VNRRWNRLAGVAVATILLSRCAAVVAPATVAPAVTAALPAVRETLTFAQEVAAVPMAAAAVLCLPLGAVECVLSPLPEITFMSGLRHIGRGVVAPFKFVEAVVTLPYDTVKAATGVVNAVPQAAGLPGLVPAP
jgi:hypothetical protein